MCIDHMRTHIGPKVENIGMALRTSMKILIFFVTCPLDGAPVPHGDAVVAQTCPRQAAAFRHCTLELHPILLTSCVVL